MIVTIDGPAGAGKSSTSRQLAQRLGFRFLDTGAMYRAVALAAVRAGLDGSAPEAVARLARSMTIRLDHDRVLVDGEDVTEQIRTPPVTAVIHWAADNPEVRQTLVVLQRREAEGGNIVCDGRDQGSLVFPQAECKIYLTASPQERARRRTEDLRQKGVQAGLEDVLAEQTERDRRDTSRPVGPLVKPADAVELVSDGMTREEVVDALEKIVRQCASNSEACPD